MNAKRNYELSYKHGDLLVFFASLIEKLRELGKAKNKTGSFQPVSILLADDDEDDRDLFEEAISRIDPVITVETAENGTELVAMMKKGKQPAIVFLDLNMPGKTGKECLELIRRHKDWKKIPVIIYSTSANKKDIQDTYSGGANLYLLKPTTFPELIELIRKAFSFDWEQQYRLPQHDFVLSNSI